MDMMQFNTLKVTIEDNIAIVAFDRPKALNTLTLNMVSEIRKAFYEILKKSIVVLPVLLFLTAYSGVPEKVMVTEGQNVDFGWGLTESVNAGSDGIKFHLLYVIKGTDLYEEYKNDNFKYIISEWRRLWNFVLNTIRWVRCWFRPINIGARRHREALKILRSALARRRCPPRSYTPLVF